MAGKKVHESSLAAVLVPRLPGRVDQMRLLPILTGDRVRSFDPAVAPHEAPDAASGVSHRSEGSSLGSAAGLCALGLLESIDQEFHGRP